MGADRSTTPRRETVHFRSGAEQCEAWLYLPSGASPVRRVPIVVMAHGIGGTKPVRLDAYAEKFQAAGYACLVFDYRYFGGSSGKPRDLIDVQSQIEDWRAAVSFARTLPKADAERVIVWGTSFGGGHAILTASDDPGIVAVIAQCPFTDGAASGRAGSLLSKAKVGALALLDLVASKWLGGNPVRVPTVGEPGQAALMATPDALRSHGALYTASGLPTGAKHVPARVALQIIRHRPGRRIKDVRAPILFCICEKDSVAPPEPTIRYARTAMDKEIKVYPEGHFDIYVGDAFMRVVADQVAFLTAQVPPTSG